MNAPPTTQNARFKPRAPPSTYKNLRVRSKSEDDKFRIFSTSHLKSSETEQELPEIRTLLQLNERIQAIQGSIHSKEIMLEEKKVRAGQLKGRKMEASDFL